MKNIVKKQFVAIILGLSLLIIPTPVTTSTVSNINLVPTSNFELLSSNWEPQRTEKENVFAQFKNRTTLEDEYFNGTIKFRNDGNDIQLIVSNVVIDFGDNFINRTLSIAEWKSGVVYLIEFNFIKAPTSIIWENAKITLNWDATNKNGNNQILTHSIKMIKKTDESTLSVNSNKVGKNLNLANTLEKDQQVLPTSKKNGFTNLLGPISPQTHYGEVLDMWEGSSYYDNLYVKGSGPTLKVVMQFTDLVSPGFYMEYKIQSVTHSWIDTFTYYWSGSWESTIMTFTMSLGWSFANGKYSFGQGTYKLVNVKAYGSSWSDSLFQDDTNNKFHMDNPTSINRVFLITIYDSYFVDSPTCLSQFHTPSSWINTATDRFEDEFDIDYYRYVKEQDWQTDVSDDNILGCTFGTEKSTSNNWGSSWYSSGSIAYTAREGIANAIGKSSGIWDLGDTTLKENHGYDQALAMSGVFNGADNAVGRGRLPGNMALAMPGWIVSYFNYYTVGDKFYILLQHELSHNFEAVHDDNPFWQLNVMRSSLVTANDNWVDPAITTIESNIYQFTNIP